MMENATNIMAMVQSNSIVKKKFDVPSKTLGNDKTNFRKELNQARKEINKDHSIEPKFVGARTQSTTEKKVENIAKVMSNNNVKAEVNADVKVDEKEKTSVEALEQTDSNQVKADKAVSDVKQLEQTEESVKSEEPIQSVLEMLQQLLQMLEMQKVEGSSKQELTQIKTKLQEVIQSLEQSLVVPMTSQGGELNKLLDSLKNDLTELVKQLEIVPDHELDSKQTNQLINQLTEKLNQAKTQSKQEHQISLQAVKPKEDYEVSQLPLASAVKVENKEVTTNNDTKALEETDDNQQIQKAESDKTSDGRDNKDNSQSNYKTGENNDVKQTVSGDKLSQADVSEIVAPQIEKENFQLNIKQANINLQKESLVKLNASDIINQVVKKADIFVQGSHQEMVMKLEPESLGKLNLKIVVENGLVTAKFIAESQQVKEVLESSFNQLKDALQQKGISVQGFSVSVGQQGAEFNSGKGFDQWKRAIKLGSKTSGEYMGLDEESSISLNPYSYHEGKVDYRA